MTTATDSVIATRQGRVGHILLNRPKALNALDLAMIRAMQAALDGWRDDPSVQAVVVEGAPAARRSAPAATSAPSAPWRWPATPPRSKRSSPRNTR
jgi:1,4-dihydroxy-2-naphthoyl-CoA synthase